MKPTNPLKPHSVENSLLMQILKHLSLYFLSTLLLFRSIEVFANPFEISFPEKLTLTTEDYIQVQEELQKIDIDFILHRTYPPSHLKQGLTSYNEFWVRCGRGLRQVLIDTEKNLYPTQELFKVGNGGQNCIVCCVPFEIPKEGNPDFAIRYKLAQTIREGLEQVGFNGYYLQLTGGFPNPTGREIRYAGVPYCFKPFMMLEAYKLGFKNILWIDAACLPINNPDILFKKIEENETVFYSFKMKVADYKKFIFPSTIDLLNELTGTNLFSNQYVCTIVFGLKMDSPRVQEVIKEYYQMVELGRPFLSCFPEEFVLTAILGKPEFRSLHDSHSGNLFSRAGPNETDCEERITQAKNDGYFFYQRKH